MDIANSAAIFRTVNALIVDDNPYARKLERGMLRQLGVQNIHEASDGLDAVDVLTSQECNLVLLDWRMPGFTGEEFLEMVRSSPDPKLRFLPVIVLSAFTHYSAVVRAATVGANAVIAKPLSVSLLGSRIEKVLRDNAMPNPASRSAKSLPIPISDTSLEKPAVQDLDELWARGMANDELEVYSI